MKQAILLLYFFGFLSVSAQKKIHVNGYVKLLGSFNHINKDYIPPFLSDAFSSHSQDYQIHNRLNFEWYGKHNLSAFAGVRNQLFWGYQVNNFPNYGNQLQDQGFLKLSTYWSNNNSYLRIFADRLFIQYLSTKWKVRIGRQRINWGINTSFNPNDLFNQYNYFDFDYEERPGADAVLVQRYLNANSSLQMAFTPGTDSLKQSVGAFLYKLNKWNTDMQFLAGYYQNDLAIGGGWAANFLWGSGLKGEFTQFIPFNKKNSSPNFTLSASLDYMFKNNMYVTLSWIFNDNGTLSPTILDQLLVTNATLSAKNLFPYKQTFMVSVQYPITSLLSGSVAWIQTPDLSNAYALPQLSYSLTQDLDFMVFAQIFLAQNALENQKWGYFSSLIFTRFKYSF